jgi:signal peptidase II
MINLKRTLLILLIVISCVGCDQATKLLAKSYLPSSSALSFIGDTVRLQYTENKGAFLSLGASLPEKWRSIIFIGGVAAFLAVVLGYLLQASNIHALTFLAFSLILGGGLSNLLDRLAYSGHVIDFINIGIGSLRTGIFNAADVAIMAGALLLVLGLMWQQKLSASSKALNSDEPGRHAG